MLSGGSEVAGDPFLSARHESSVIDNPSNVHIRGQGAQNASFVGRRLGSLATGSACLGGRTGYPENRHG
jgi:hypothetical protein